MISQKIVTNQIDEFSVSIVVPTYHECENIPYLVERIVKSMTPLSCPFEIIIVDDNSGDGTSEKVKELADAGNPVRLVTRHNERGLSSAVIRGFNEAEAEILVCMDADLSHPPEVIPHFLKVLSDGKNEFVIGSRYVLGGSTDETWGMFRRLNSLIATLLARPFTSVKDSMSGFFALPRKVFKKAVSLSPIGYKIGLELIVKCQCQRIYEVPIHFANRTHGKSKLCFREQLRYLQHLKQLSDFKFGTLSKFILFCLVGSTGVIINILAYALLMKMPINVLISYAMAIWLAMTWNFVLNRCVTFSERRNKHIVRQYLKFIAACLLGAFVNWSVSMSLTFYMDFFAKNKLLGAIPGIIAGTVCNFMLSLLLVFPKMDSFGPQYLFMNRGGRTQAQSQVRNKLKKSGDPCNAD